MIPVHPRISCYDSGMGWSSRPVLRGKADIDRSLFVLQVATLPISMGFMAVLVMDFVDGLRLYDFLLSILS